MKVKMELLTDAIFGNGISIPGGEDISVLFDEYGFPYYKGGTFKGVFREELERYLEWTNDTEPNLKIKKLLGESGDDDVLETRKIKFGDFKLSQNVREKIINEVKQKNVIIDILSHLRMFTSINENGIVKEGSLRSCRCINKGLCLYSNIECSPEDEELIKNVILMIKEVGTMRNRGFGKVKLTVI